MKRDSKDKKSKNVIKVSATYFQGSEHNFEFHSIDDNPRKEAIDNWKEHKDLSNEILQVGLSDVARKKQLYKSLIIKSGFEFIETPQIWEIYEKWIFGDQQTINAK